MTATLSTTATGGSGFTYTWSSTSGTANLSNIHAQNPLFTATLAGHYTYMVTVTNSAGCSTTASVSICVIDAVDHAHSGKVLLCHASGCSPVTLSLNPGDVASHLPCHSSTDHLGPVGSACTAGRESQPEAPIATVDELTVTAFPNPFGDEIHVKIQSDKKDNVDVIVYDVTGRERDNRLNQDITADFSFGQNFTPGVYFIEVRQGNESRKVKVVKY